MTTRKLIAAAGLACGLALLNGGSAWAANQAVISDPQDITLGFLSGYDVQSATFTLDANDTLTVAIKPYGVPGDADGDGNPNSAAVGSTIQDDPGVGITESMSVFTACADPENCNPDVMFQYANNQLTVLNLLTGTPIVGAATLTFDSTVYTLTIPNFTQFKASLGGQPINFGAFSFSGSGTDQLPEDIAPDTGCAILSLEPPVVSKTPFECYGINKVIVDDKTGTTKDKIKVEKAGFRLAAGDTVDLANDMVQIRVDGLVFDFPAGSFVQKGSKPDYVFKSASGVKPQVEARLRFDKKQWELKVEEGDASLIDNSDGVDIALMINGFESTENVLLMPKNGGKLEYKASPKKNCKLPTDSNSSEEALPGTNKLSCLGSLTVEHSPDGTLITKTTAGADLLHPNTVFTDDATGDMAIIHTSCSQCLRCGDVYGNFTIQEISGVPGDKMSRECGVPDASCSLLPTSP